MLSGSEQHFRDLTDSRQKTVCVVSFTFQRKCQLQEEQACWASRLSDIRDISFTISHSFALQLAVPHNDEWTRFARTLVEIRANRADSEEESTVELSA